MGWQEERDGTLRCGRCFRDLALPTGQQQHIVFNDGSMRCYAPEGQEGREGGGCTSTFVVLESEERRRRIAEVANWSPVVPVRQTWVCDGCMNRVHRDEIYDMADGEHVLCNACMAKDNAR